MNTDVFDEKTPCTDCNDPWSGNNAISNLLFDDNKKFHSSVPFFKIEHSSFSEFFILLNSGGTIAKTFYIPLPRFILRIIDFIDNILTRLFYKTFALQRQVVLKKLEMP